MGVLDYLLQRAAAGPEAGATSGSASLPAPVVPVALDELLLVDDGMEPPLDAAEPATTARGARPTPKKAAKVQRPPTAYLLFAAERRAQLLAQDASLSFGDISKTVGAAWQALDEDGKLPFDRRAAVKKAAFDQRVVALGAASPATQSGGTVRRAMPAKARHGYRGTGAASLAKGDAMLPHTLQNSKNPGRVRGGMTSQITVDASKMGRVRARGAEHARHPLSGLALGPCSTRVRAPTAPTLGMGRSGGSRKRPPRSCASSRSPRPWPPQNGWRRRKPRRRRRPRRRANASPEWRFRALPLRVGRTTAIAGPGSRRRPCARARWGFSLGRISH